MSDKAASILDATIDDLPDLPGFKVPPTGAYVVLIMSNLEKKVGDHPALEAKFKIVEVLEVSEQNVPDDQMPLKDDEFATVFMLDNDTGTGFLKEYLAILAVPLNTKSNREIMEKSKGMALQIAAKRTYDKEKDRHYLNIKKMEVI